MTVPQQDPRWRKSTYSQDEGECVELANIGAVRDSKNPAAGALPVDLRHLIGAVKADRLTR